MVKTPKYKLRRVFLGGLPTNITAEEVKNRFTPFGTPLSIEVVKNDGGEGRGFAYVDLQCTLDQWKRCKSTYHGKTWKEGKRLRLEEAKDDYKARLTEEQSRPEKAKKRKKSKRSGHTKDMSLVTEETVERRKGWKRGRFGRPMAIMHLRKMDGEMITVDPSAFKESLQKLFGNVRPKPIRDLTWHYEDDTKQGSVSIKSNPWEMVVSTGTTFKLGLFPEDTKSATVEPVETTKEAAPVSMLPDYSFGRLFYALDGLPVDTNVDLQDIISEISSNQSLYRADYRNRHKQALKLARRKTSLAKSRIAINKH